VVLPRHPWDSPLPEDYAAQGVRLEPIGFTSCEGDHCFKHSATAITNFILTLFIVYVLLQCFWQRNVKPALQQSIRTLISLAEELCRSLGPGCHAPWLGTFSRLP
jgi:hypothetical protein